MKQSTAKKLIKMTNELYENEAASFDQTRRDLWEKEILDFVGKIKPGSSVLDLGCGNARLLPQIVRRITRKCSQIKIEYLGIDTSKKLITLNKKKYPDANFRAGDGLKMKFKDRFDYVVSIAVLHHIPSEKLQLKFLTNIHRALKPNGQILITVWNRHQLKYKKYFSKKYKIDFAKKFPRKSASLSALISEIDAVDLIVPWKQSGQFRYIHAFKPDELKNLALKAGFKKIKVFASKMGKITNLDNALKYLFTSRKVKNS